MRQRKAQERKRAKLAALFDMNPRDGMMFKNPMHVYATVVVLPALSVGAFAVTLIGGFLTWSPLLGVAALAGLTTAASLSLVYTWFTTRGWADAIMSIEHKARKTQAYKKERP